MNAVLFPVLFPAVMDMCAQDVVAASTEMLKLKLLDGWQQEIAMAVVDLVSLTGMWIAMYFNYVAISESSRVQLQKDYNVYNSLADADVRLLLPQKVGTMDITSTTQTLNSSSLSGNGTEADTPQLEGPGSTFLDSDALGQGSDKWYLQDNNTDLDRIGMNNVHMATAISYQAASGVIASYCILMMMLVALLKLSMINLRLGITVQAFISSFSVRMYTLSADVNAVLCSSEEGRSRFLTPPWLVH